MQNLSKGLVASSKKYFNLTFSSTPISFKPRVKFATVNKPAGMYIYDIDADGKPDMLLANSVDQKISIYRNTTVSGSITSKSFAPKVDIAVDGAPLAITAGDIDGDGKPEILVANNSGKKIAVYGNNNSPGTINSSSFSLKFNIPFNTYPLDIKLADLNRDGKLDLLVTEQQNDHYFYNAYLNRSEGIPTAGSFVSTIIVNYSSRQATWAADVDDDNKPDFINVAYNDMINVGKNNFEIGSYYNQFTGNFFLAGTEPQSICTGDLDGDGKPELIVANKAGNNISVLRNTITNNSIDYYAFAPKIDIPTLANPKRVTVGDVNGDGKPDIVVTFFDSNKVMVYYNAATAGNITAGSFVEKKQLDGGSDADNISIGDIDGDGRADLAFTNYGSNT
ncbi:MAG: VCBS repeat-containing protein, partial [Sphingobacteriaceae bacterium]